MANRLMERTSQFWDKSSYKKVLLLLLHCTLFPTGLTRYLCVIREKRRWCQKHGGGAKRPSCIACQLSSSWGKAYNITIRISNACTCVETCVNNRMSLDIKQARFHRSKIWVECWTSLAGTPLWHVSVSQKWCVHFVLFLSPFLCLVFSLEVAASQPLVSLHYRAETLSFPI